MDFIYFYFKKDIKIKTMYKQKYEISVKKSY